MTLVIAILVTLAAAIIVFVLVAWLAFVVLDIETFGSRENNHQHHGLLPTTEPDPIESYPSAIMTAKGIVAWKRAKHLPPVPVNPLGESQPNRRMPS